MKAHFSNAKYAIQYKILLCKMVPKDAANEMKLDDKYQHVYIYDADMDEIRRIVHCEWSTANRPCRYTVVAQFISKRSGDTEANG
jgi:hypothetical protein